MSRFPIRVSLSLSIRREARQRLSSNALVTTDTEAGCHRGARKHGISIPSAANGMAKHVVPANCKEQVLVDFRQRRARQKRIAIDNHR